MTGTGTYKAGDDLEVNGVRLRITGAPAAGDSFNVQAASSRDIFSTMDNLVAALAPTLAPLHRWPRSRTSCRAHCATWRVRPSG